MKKLYIKTGQVLGPLFSASIIFVIVNFVNTSAESNEDAIGFGMLLPLFLLQLIPLILAFTFTTAISCFMLLKEKENKKKFLPTERWVVLFKFNILSTVLGLAMFAGPTLLFLIAFFGTI